MSGVPRFGVFGRRSDGVAAAASKTPDEEGEAPIPQRSKSGGFASVFRKSPRKSPRSPRSGLGADVAAAMVVTVCGDGGAVFTEEGGSALFFRVTFGSVNHRLTGNVVWLQEVPAADGMAISIHACRAQKIGGEKVLASASFTLPGNKVMVSGATGDGEECVVALSKGGKTLGQARVRVRVLVWRMGLPKGGLVFDPRSNDKCLLRIASRVEDMSVYLYGDTPPEVAFGICKSMRAYPPPVTIGSDALHYWQIVKLPTAGIPVFVSGMFSEGNNDDRESALAAVIAELSAVLVGFGYVEVGPRLWRPLPSSSPLPAAISTAFVMTWNANQLIVWGALPDAVEDRISRLNIPPPTTCAFESSIGLPSRVWKGHFDNDLLSTIQGTLRHLTDWQPLHSWMHCMIISVHAPKASPPRLASVKRKGAARVSLQDVQFDENAAWDATTMSMTLSLDDISGLVSDFRSAGFGAERIRKILDVAGMGDCERVESVEETMVLLHTCKLWKTIAYQGNLALLSLKRRLWLIVVDLMASEGILVSSHLSSLGSVRLNYSGPPDVPLRHAFFSLCVSSKKGITLDFFMADNAERERICKIISTASETIATLRRVEMPWGVTHFEMSIRDSERFAPSNASNASFNEIMSGEATEVMKPELIYSRAISTFVLVVNVLVNTCHYDPHVYMWTSSIATRIAELSFLYGEQQKHSSELFSQASGGPPAISKSVSLSLFDSSRLRWDCLVVCEMLLRRSEQQLGPDRGVRWIFIVSPDNSKYTDIYGPIHRRECDTVAARIPDAKLIHGHEKNQKNRHLCWSFQWPDALRDCTEGARTHLVISLLLENGWQLACFNNTTLTNAFLVNDNETPP